MRSKILSTVSVVILMSLAPQLALAGFEFVAPSGSSAANSPVAPANSADNGAALTPSAPIVPDATVQNEALPEPAPVREQPISGRSTTPIAPIDVPLTPVITDSDALSIESRPFSKPSARSASASSIPTPLSAPVDNLAPVATMPEAPSMSGTSGGAEVQGFGRDVPMAIALQQIVPASYRYSFEKPINPSMKISWTGGKPWKEIIADIARTNDMNVDIASNVVSFSRHSPMDMIAANSAIDTSGDMVQGVPLKPYTGQYVPTNPMSQQPTQVASSTLPAPKGDMHDMIYDGPSSTTTTTTQTIATSTKRKPLASISDTPSDAVPAEKSAFFDGLMDNNQSNANSVKEKKIIAANNKPVDILDHVSVASPNPAQTSSAAAMPKPVDSVPMPLAPLPAAPMGAPVDITKRIDNSPVTANDLPAVNNSTPIAQTSVASDMSEPSPQANLTSTQEWMAHKGQTLRQTLTAWSEQAGVSLVWSSEYDYPLQTDVRIQANYADTVRTLLAGFAKAQPRPIGRLFKNDKVGAQPVLIIETQRLTN